MGKEDRRRRKAYDGSGVGEEPYEEDYIEEDYQDYSDMENDAVDDEYMEDGDYEEEGWNEDEYEEDDFEEDYRNGPEKKSTGTMKRKRLGTEEKIYNIRRANRNLIGTAAFSAAFLRALLSICAPMSPPIPKPCSITATTAGRLSLQRKTPAAPFILRTEKSLHRQSGMNREKKSAIIPMTTCLPIS